MRDSLKVGAIAGVVLVGAAALTLVPTKKPMPSAHQNRIVCVEKMK